MKAKATAQTAEGAMESIGIHSLACCHDGCGEGGFFAGEDGAQIEDDVIVFDTRDHWWAACGFAEVGF